VQWTGIVLLCGLLGTLTPARGEPGTAVIDNMPVTVYHRLIYECPNFDTAVGAAMQSNLTVGVTKERGGKQFATILLEFRDWLPKVKFPAEKGHTLKTGVTLEKDEFKELLRAYNNYIANYKYSKRDTVLNGKHGEIGGLELLTLELDEKRATSKADSLGLRVAEKEPKALDLRFENSLVFNNEYDEKVGVLGILLDNKDCTAFGEMLCQTKEELGW